MEEHRHSVVCPVLSGTLSDDNEAKLIETVQRHAKKEHDMELTKEGARDLFKDRAK